MVLDIVCWLYCAVANLKLHIIVNVSSFSMLIFYNNVERIAPVHWHVKGPSHTYQVCLKCGGESIVCTMLARDIS